MKIYRLIWKSTISHRIPEAFLWFSIVFIHHKWQGATLLSLWAEVASRGTVRLKTLDNRKRVNFRKISKLSVDKKGYKNEKLEIAQEKGTKLSIKLSIKVLLYLTLSVVLNIFCEGLSVKTILTWSPSPDTMQLSVSAIFNISKIFLAVKLDIQSNGNVTNGSILNFSKSTISCFILQYKL